jgi:hypothetical protein
MSTSHTINYVASDMTARTAHLASVDWHAASPLYDPLQCSADKEEWIVYNPQDGTTGQDYHILIHATDGSTKYIEIETQAWDASPGTGQPNRRITFKFKIYNVDGSDEREDSEVYFIDPDPNSHHTSDPNNLTHYRVTIPDFISFPGEPDFQID